MLKKSEKQLNKMRRVREQNLRAGGQVCMGENTGNGEYARDGDWFGVSRTQKLKSITKNVQVSLKLHQYH